MQEYLAKEKAIEQIYIKYRHDIYKLALSLTQDTYTADDIVQKVFVKLFLHYDAIRNKDGIFSYLMRCTRNLAHNWTRDMAHEYRTEEYSDNLPEDFVTLESAEDAVFRQEREKQMKDFLAQIMEDLAWENESWYDILNLIYCLGMSHEEAADQLGITMQVLYSKFYRARRRIRKKYGEQFLKLLEGNDNENNS